MKKCSESYLFTQNWSTIWELRYFFKYSLEMLTNNSTEYLLTLVHSFRTAMVKLRFLRIFKLEATQSRCLLFILLIDVWMSLHYTVLKFMDFVLKYFTTVSTDSQEWVQRIAASMFLKVLTEIAETTSSCSMSNYGSLLKKLYAAAVSVGLWSNFSW